MVRIYIYPMTIEKRIHLGEPFTKEECPHADISLTTLVLEFSKRRLENETQKYQLSKFNN